LKKFISTLFRFSLFFFIIEKSFFVFIFNAPNLEVDKRLEYVLKGNMNKDVIFIGSSRGARAVIADQITKETQLSSYNLCYPGSDITFHKFLLNALIKHNEPPKKIVLIVDDFAQLHPDKTISFRYDRLYPLVKYNYINQELINKKENSILSWVLAMSRGNKENLSFSKKTFKPNDTVRKYGDMPYTFHRKNRSFIYQQTPNPYNIDEESNEKLDAFLEFQAICVKNEIKLILAFPPNFRAHNLAFENRLKNLAHPKTKFFIYNRNNNLYRDKSYYYDESHLKVNGAEIFTRELAEFIKNI